MELRPERNEFNSQSKETNFYPISKKPTKERLNEDAQIASHKIGAIGQDHFEKSSDLLETTRILEPRQKKTFEDYKRNIFAKYDVDQEGKLVTKEGYRTGLYKEQLEKLIDTAKKALQSDEDISIYKEMNNNHVIIATLSEEGTLKLFSQQKDPEILGRGNWGVVRGVVNVTKASQAALKVAHGSGIGYIMQEYRLLRKEGLEGLGIQIRPSGLFYEDGFVRMMGKRYEGTLLQKSLKDDDEENRQPIQLDLKEGLRCAYQTLVGLERGHREGIIFGDRKLGNVLMEKGKRYDLADLGGSIESAFIYTIFNHGMPPISMDSKYTSHDDLKKLADAKEKRDAAACINLLQKMDVLGNGITLWEVFIGKNFPRENNTYPFQRDVKSFANPGSPEVAAELDKLVKNPMEGQIALSSGMRDVILSMLNPNIDERQNSNESLVNFKRRLDIDYTNFGKEFRKQEEDEIARIANRQLRRRAKHI